jgi:ribosome-associated protein
MSEIRLAPGVTVADSALTFSTARSSGPGGQNVNKTESKVELRVPVGAIIGLSWKAQDRLVWLAGNRLTADGDLVLSCDETRSQRQNRIVVLERLSELVRDAQAVPKPRKRTKPSRGSIERRLQDKAAVSDKKRDRRDQGST